MIAHEKAADSREVGGSKNSKDHTRIYPRISPENQEKVELARLKYLARRLHSLGERAVFEYVREIVSGRDPVGRLEVYARLDPAALAALGGVALPPVARLVGEAWA
jgi:hypothetical protein